MKHNLPAYTSNHYNKTQNSHHTGNKAEPKTEDP